jgi:hypothetical protein
LPANRKSIRTPKTPSIKNLKQFEKAKAAQPPRMLSELSSNLPSTTISEREYQAIKEIARAQHRALQRLSQVVVAVRGAHHVSRRYLALPDFRCERSGASWRVVSCADGALTQIFDEFSHQAPVVIVDRAGDIAPSFAVQPARRR